MNKYKFCEVDPVNESGILCDSCTKGNEYNLFIKCKNCNSNTTLMESEFNCIRLLHTELNSGYSDITDLINTGSGLMLYTSECPKCGHKKEKKKKQFGTYWETI